MAEPEKDQIAPRKSPRVARYVIAAVAVVGLGIVSYFVWRYVNTYETTDDAQIDGHINAISGRITGTVTEVRAEDAQYVKAGDVLLMLDPRVLILDEPTANLAPQLADKLLREQVSGLGARGKAVLLVEQRARAALDIAAWTSVLVSGSTRLEGRPGDLLARADFAELFLGAETSTKQSRESEVERA